MSGCRQGWDIDCVVPVPDGSRPAAIQISAELGLPYREGLVKNRYVGRTFIMPDQRSAPCCPALLLRMCSSQFAPDPPDKRQARPASASSPCGPWPAWVSGAVCGSTL